MGRAGEAINRAISHAYQALWARSITKRILILRGVLGRAWGGAGVPSGRVTQTALSSECAEGVVEGAGEILER